MAFTAQQAFSSLASNGVLRRQTETFKTSGFRPRPVTNKVRRAVVAESATEEAIKKRASQIAKNFGIKNDEYNWYKAVYELEDKVYKTKTKGSFPSKEYALSLTANGKVLSPWHDVPLYNEDGTYNFVVEIPRNTKAKMEVATDKPWNPIVQDIKKVKSEVMIGEKKSKTTKKVLRDYPYNIYWNYGMMPQTWEDPKYEHPDVPDVKGDNDPIDVVEIGTRVYPMGTVMKVKVLGAYAMIDQGELDWKVIAINAKDPLAAHMHTVEDVERMMPGELERIKVWFRDYKIPDGKEPNEYALDGKCASKEDAIKVIEKAHKLYADLVMGKTDNPKGGKFALTL